MIPYNTGFVKNYFQKLIVPNMALYTYIPKGVCSKKITFNMTDEGIISNLKFENGCPGNLAAIGKLCEGKNAKDISEILRGTKCGNKSTSCADQLSKALDEALAKVSK